MCISPSEHYRDIENTLREVHNNYITNTEDQSPHLDDKSGVDDLKEDFTSGNEVSTSSAENTIPHAEAQLQENSFLTFLGGLLTIVECNHSFIIIRQVYQKHGYRVPGSILKWLKKQRT